MDLQQQQSPVSSTPLFSKSVQKTLPSAINFAKSLRRGFNNNNKIICIYEEKPFTVQIKSINQFSPLQQYQDLISICNSQYQQPSRNYDISQLNDGQIRFQSVPYDCIQFAQNLWLISTKAMPPRIYKQNFGFPYFHTDHIASFTNKKKNSQLYLSPIQFAAFQNTVVGGGIRFLSTYDLEKGTQNLFPIFNKVNISSVAMMNGNYTIIGTFNGGITLFDLRDSTYSQKNQANFERSIQRPHVEAVMSISTTSSNQYIFSTSARMDNFTYIFDIRKFPNNYVYRMQEERNTNQRISTTFSCDGKRILSGSENSSILEWNYEKEQITRYRLPGKQTINSVIEMNNEQESNIVFATGHRIFQNVDQEQSSEQEKDATRYNREKNSQKILNRVGVIQRKMKIQQGLD